MQVNPLLGVTLAILLLFGGKGLIARVSWLRRYSIPEALVGGVIGALIVCALYYGAGITVSFDHSIRDGLLLYFFAAIGLSSDMRTLAAGGRPFLILTSLSIVFILLQNAAGMGLASAFGMDPRAGLMVGSISLIGGVGTTVAWSHHFAENLGINNAQELGLAANTMGLIAACIIGGPVAAFLMHRHQVKPSGEGELEVGVLHRDEDRAHLGYHGVLLAILWLNCALILGQGITQLTDMTPLKLPSFVGCLLAGIILRAVADLGRFGGTGRLWDFPIMQPGLALISDVCLGLFLTLALMGLQLWELEHVLPFITLAMLVQIALTIAFVLLVVFRAMGRNYEAAVVCAGFGGIALGSTATAVANMTAVTREFGAARQAFVVVPLVCGFSIDLVNAIVIGLLAG
ncbi:MAG: sodium/glutamate symporter [Comamonadaceae bacterium]|nr:sodium/glutamate symporter [Comamonadaceae bacterium]